MPHAIFELDQMDKLPLWALVLMASRAARRAVLSLRGRIAEAEQRARLAGCDALDAAAEAGSCAKVKEALRRAASAQPTASGREVASSLYFAADAAQAAEASLDFSAAETACVNSVMKSIGEARSVKTMTALQSTILLSSDFDQLRFTCGEARIGRYDGLGRDVMLRLTPVHPPEPVEPPGPSAEDQAR